MPSCFSCASKQDSDDSPYQLHPKTRTERDALHAVERNQSGVAADNNSYAEEMQPLTHTEVKTVKSGNTVTVTRTTHTRVVNTRQTPIVIEEELEPVDSQRVYQTTVIKAPQTKRNKRFNLKSVLVRRPKNKTQPGPQGDQVEERCLETHNQYRAKHGMQPLVLNKELCKYATEWANHLAKKNILQHRKKNKYGENLALGTGLEYTTEDAVKSWYNEIEHYDFKKPGFSSQTGHFSQVVWQESTQLGVGVAEKDDRTWIVCNYDPPGNVMGQYMDNVVAPKGKQNKSKVSREAIDNTRLEGGLDNSKPGTSEAFKKVPSSKSHKGSKFELECLEAHNKLRAMHGCAPLTLNKTLCNLANDWATHLAKIRSMYHRPQNEYGENIYQSINRDPSGEDVVQSWYDEIKNYKFKKPGFSTGTGHFTQVVWSDTAELGVGKAKVDNITFVVCNYNPPGNVLSQYNAQVPPIGGFKDDAGKKEAHDSSNNKTPDINGHPPAMTNKKSNIFTTNWFKSKKDNKQ